MLNILTGVPADRQNDKSFVKRFIASDAPKIICGSSTMKMFCRIQNITPKIKISFENNTTVAKYEIEGIYFATEGIITLNNCYKVLIGEKNESPDALKLAKELLNFQTINFFVGTAQNKDSNTYKLFDLLPRKQIIEKIILYLKQKNKTVNKLEI